MLQAAFGQRGSFMQPSPVVSGNPHIEAERASKVAKPSLDLRMGTITFLV